MTDTVQQAEQSVKSTVEVDLKKLEDWFQEHFANLVPETKALAERAYTHLKSILGVQPESSPSQDSTASKPE